MGDAAGQPADRFHFLRLAQLFFQTLQINLFGSGIHGWNPALSRCSNLVPKVASCGAIWKKSEGLYELRMPGFRPKGYNLTCERRPSSKEWIMPLKIASRSP